MKLILLISLAIFLSISGCNGQTKKQETKETQPQTNIKVKKHYDKNGNIVGYDSVYSSYYSNIKGDTVLNDSILNNFKDAFNQKYLFSKQPFFKDFFFDDSLLYNDFYKKDFFFDRFRNNMSGMDSLFREMDIMKNDFFNKQFKPNVIK